MNPLPAMDKYEQFVDALDFIDDEAMRFEYIIDLGKKVGTGGLADADKIDANLMYGCMSKVWITHRVQGERHYFAGTSDAIIVKGLVHMVTESFSQLRTEQLNAITCDHVEKLNLGALTSQRQIGMLAMLDHLKKAVK